MKLKTLILLSIFLTAPVMAAHHEQVQDKPSMSASQTLVVTSQVDAINHETREVTLRHADGETVTFTASEEARNLDQVSVGDIVTAEYLEEVSIQVVAAEGGEAGAAGLAAVARTEKGEMPGVAAIDSSIEVLTVEEINIEANTFKLKNAAGEVRQFTARDPENLKRSAVGDLVVVTATRAVAISVEAAPGE